MEEFVYIVGWLLIISFLIIPLLVFTILEFTKNNRTKRIVKIGGVLAILILPVASGWWTDKSTEILLIHYNALEYSDDFDTYIFSFDNVKAEHTERVKQLNTRYFGIGWPAKVILTSIFYFPLVLIIYYLQYLLFKYLKKKNILSSSTDRNNRT